MITAKSRKWLPWETSSSSLELCCIGLQMAWRQKWHKESKLVIFIQFLFHFLKNYTWLLPILYPASRVSFKLSSFPICQGRWMETLLAGYTFPCKLLYLHCYVMSSEAQVKASTWYDLPIRYNNNIPKGSWDTYVSCSYDKTFHNTYMT